MTKKEFIFNSKRAIFKDIVKGLNQILGHNKTAQAALSLLSTVRIDVELRKLDKIPKVTKKFKSLARNVTAYSKKDEDTISLMFFYTTDSELPKLYKSIESNTWYLTYLYLREMLMIAHNYNTYTFYNKTRNQITKLDSTISPEYFLAIQNTACYLQLNNLIESLYRASGSSAQFDKLKKYEAYDPDLAKTSFKDILSFVIANMEVSNTADLIELDLPDGATVQFTDFPLVNDDYDGIITDLGETIESTFKQAAKGTDSASIFATAFEANTKVKTGWFKKLKKTLSRIVYYQTNDFSSSWGSLNSVYRHKFKSPKHVYTETGLEMVLSIDSSGSMMTEELSRIAGVISKHGKNITKLNILIYDTEILHEFTLHPKDLNVNSTEFKKALLTRYAAGGTSNYAVFKWLDTNIKDKSKLLYLNYSDNYSDVPESLAKFPSLRESQMVFICTINNPLNIPGTTDITLE